MILLFISAVLLTHHCFGFSSDIYYRRSTVLRDRAEAADGFDGSSMRNETTRDRGSSEISSSLEKMLSSLKFGFETTAPLPRRTIASKLLTSQIALCYSSKVAEGTIFGSIDTLPRMRGCQPLLDANNYASKSGDISSGDSYRATSSSSSSSSSSSTSYSFGAVPLPLPCVVSGTCPYTQFRCSKGHRWVTEPGRPVCFHCPICATSRKVYGKGRAAFNKGRIASLLASWTDTTGGSCVDLDADLERMTNWASKIRVSCEAGHFRAVSASNLLLGKTGCRDCRRRDMSLELKEFHETAEHFGGKFLRFADAQEWTLSGDEIMPIPLRTNAKKTGSTAAAPAPAKQAPRPKNLSRTKCVWQCARGHDFEQYMSNIRRRRDTKRQVSWCPVCRRRDGITFQWKPA